MRRSWISSWRSNVAWKLSNWAREPYPRERLRRLADRDGDSLLAELRWVTPSSCERSLRATSLPGGTGRQRYKAPGFEYRKLRLYVFDPHRQPLRNLNVRNRGCLACCVIV